jgi:hypothetical protein
VNTCVCMYLCIHALRIAHELAFDQKEYVCVIYMYAITYIHMVYTFYGLD